MPSVKMHKKTITFGVFLCIFYKVKKIKSFLHFPIDKLKSIVYNMYNKLSKTIKKKRGFYNVVYQLSFSARHKKVIETTKQVKKNGIEKTIQELQEHNNCIYVFADGFEHNGKKLEHETMQELKAIHGKLKFCIVR